MKEKRDTVEKGLSLPLPCSPPRHKRNLVPDVILVVLDKLDLETVKCGLDSTVSPVVDVPHREVSVLRGESAGLEAGACGADDNVCCALTVLHTVAHVHGAGALIRVLVAHKHQVHLKHGEEGGSEGGAGW